MRTISSSFMAVPVGVTFTCNGTTYVKKSSRTAWLSYVDSGLWFYFGKGESVVFETEQPVNQSVQIIVNNSK